jgi:hypothetical protein
MVNRQRSYSLAVTPPTQAVGRVVNLLPAGVYIVEHEQRGWQCRLAASCLLAPQIGDEVMIAGHEHHLWLLAVLTRADPQLPFSLNVAGALDIAAQGDLTFACPGRLALQSQTLNIGAEQGECHIDDLRYHGKSVSAGVASCSIVGKSMETVWHTVVAISHRLLRKVTQTEHVRVGQWDCEARDYARIHGKQLIVTSEAITKLDSEQIHVG